MSEQTKPEPLALLRMKHGKVTTHAESSMGKSWSFMSPISSRRSSPASPQVPLPGLGEAQVVRPAELAGEELERLPKRVSGEADVREFVRRLHRHQRQVQHVLVESVWRGLARRR